MKKIAILSSTNGTNLQSFIDARNAGEFKNIEIACFLTSKPNCGALEKAKKAGLTTHVIPSKGKTREEYDQQVMEVLESYDLDLIVLGGYMRIIGPEMIQRYKQKIINVHPSLLPKFGGKMSKSVHQAVIEADEKETGITIHYVDEGVDTGEILLQKKVVVDPDDTPESLKEKVQELEKECYPKTVRELLYHPHSN